MTPRQLPREADALVHCCRVLLREIICLGVISDDGVLAAPEVRDDAWRAAFDALGSARSLSERWQKLRSDRVVSVAHVVETAEAASQLGFAWIDAHKAQQPDRVNPGTRPGDGAACYFELLGLGSTFGPDDVARAFRKAVLVHHPDRGGSVAKFLAVTEERDLAFAMVRERAA